MQTAEARRVAEVDAELAAAAQAPFRGLSTAATWSDQTRAGATSDLIGSSLRQASGAESQGNTPLLTGSSASVGASQGGAAQPQANQEFVRGNLNSFLSTRPKRSYMYSDHRE